MLTGIHLCPDLQHIFETHARIYKFALQQHDNIGIVFVYLLSLCRFRRTLCIPLLDVGL